MAKCHTAELYMYIVRNVIGSELRSPRLLTGAVVIAILGKGHHH